MACTGAPARLCDACNLRPADVRPERCWLKKEAELMKRRPPGTHWEGAIDWVLRQPCSCVFCANCRQCRQEHLRRMVAVQGPKGQAAAILEEDLAFCKTEP